jgi:hypothetical protein
MRRGILASRDELKALRQRTGRKAFESIYETLRRRCALILETAPVTEAQWCSLWLQGVWASGLQAARGIQGRVMDLLIAHHIDPNPAYRDRALEELRMLARWSTWADPCHNQMTVDPCTAEAAVAMAVGMDWLWEDLTADDRKLFRDALMVKAIEPYVKASGQGAVWANCYHSWNAVVNGGVGVAALALADESPQARRVYQLARKNLGSFFAALGPEGGWDEGTGYWGYAMRYVLLLAEAARRLEDDQTLFHNRGMDATGLFGVYFAPNGQAASFGDNPSVPLLGTLYLLARQFARPEVTWWLDTYAFHRDVSTTDWSAAGLAMLLRPPGARAPRKPALKPVKVFDGIGWAALADAWPNPKFYVAAKTGDLAANHSHHDMASLQVQVDGEMLLTDLGSAPYSREYLSEGREDFYEVQARAHNTVTVADRDHRIDAQGRIADSRGGPEFRYVACDAGAACGENVRFIRHVLMVVDRASQAGRMLIVLDELENGVPEKVETFWHTQGQIRLDPQTMTGAIQGQRAALHFALASTVKTAAFTKSNPLDRRRRDNVLQMSAGVLGPALTVSVFARGKIAGVRIVEESEGHMAVQVGDVVARFVESRRSLKLVGVTGTD